MWLPLLSAALAAPAVFLPVVGDEPSLVAAMHPEGRAHHTWRVQWAPMWTGADPNRAERLAVTPEVALEGGAWRALMEAWHRLPVGAPLAVVTVRVDGRVVARQTTRARWFPGWGAGGLQADAVAFEVPNDGGEVVVEVEEAGTRGLWVGAIQLAVAAPRPFYALKHCANDVARAERALADGANAVEVDVQHGPGGLRFDHPFGSPPVCWGSATPSRQTSAYLGRLGELHAAGELALVLLDLKRPGVDTAAYVDAVVDAVRAAGLPDEAVALSVSDCDAGAVAAELSRRAFRGPLDVWQDVAVAACPGRPAVDPSCRTCDAWLSDVAERASVIGLGADPMYLARPMPQWLEPLQRLIHRRDEVGAPTKVYYWTIDRRVSMRVALNLGVDGLIVNRPRDLDAVLGERPYRDLFRLATPTDAAPLVVHGARSEAATGTQ
jgi:hypothetical protein